LQPDTTIPPSSAVRRRMSARAYLAIMAAAALAPLLLVAGFVINVLLHAERDAAIRSVLEAARAISLALDQELAAGETLLRALATSAHLAKGDLAGFQQQAAAALQNDAVSIVLYDASTRPLLDTSLPFGTTLDGSSTSERIAAVLTAGQLRVSKLERSRDGKRLTVAIDLPVSTESERYVLSLVYAASHFQRVLLSRKVPDHWIVGVFDTDHATIARSHRVAEFVGRPGSDDMRKAAAGVLEGELRHPSREGIDLYDVFTRSTRSGWLVAIGVPAQALDAVAERAVGMAVLGTLAALMLAAIIAFLLGHRLSRSLDDIAAAASALGRGEPLPAYKPSIREIDRLHAALAETHTVLERETEGRARAEAERLQLFESEQAARQLAEQQNRAKDEFLAMLGHELRNPLSAISGAVALMKAPAAQEQHKLHAREVISRQVQHLSRVVDDLLDLSRVMTGKIILEFKPLDLAQAAANCLASMRTAGRAGEHALKTRLEPAWIDGDPTRLEQIIGNLLSNAFKYTPPEGRIELTVAVEGDDAVLTVRDTGLGIPKRLLPHVFDVFVQGDQSLERAKGGLGIGLALVQRLVSLHGGSVSAESAGDGKGATFTVRLPRVAAPDAASGVVAAAPARRRLRVLVVDDHEDSRTMLRLLLEQTGHEAIEAVDGIDGVQLALSRRPDVAIIDIGLPGINGYEVARRLRALPISGTIALIALTGYGQDEDRRRALQSGFDRHLVKPVDAERLTQALMEVTAAQG
jgi:signal transduction histidine kinase/ActR/RegA family two-component response regulator